MGNQSATPTPHHQQSNSSKSNTVNGKDQQRTTLAASSHQGKGPQAHPHNGPSLSYYNRVGVMNYHHQHNNDNNQNTT